MKLVHINLNEGILVDAINCTEYSGSVVKTKI